MEIKKRLLSLVLAVTAILCSPAMFLSSAASTYANSTYQGFYYLNDNTANKNTITVSASNIVVNNFYYKHNGSKITIYASNPTDAYFNNTKFLASYSNIHQTNGSGSIVKKNLGVAYISTQNISATTTLVFIIKKIHVTYEGYTYTQSL